METFIFGDEEVISLSHAKVYVFSDSVLCPGKMNENPQSNSWFFFLTDSIWTTKIQIKYIDTKKQLADILTKGNFTRDEWNHLLCLFNISHFSSTVCSDTMAKRSQHDSGEERVIAKSRPMMNLVAMAELEAKHQKYKGRVVLRGDIVKDDSGSYAVFTEHGSSAPQMTAVKSWISSPDCQVAMDKQLTQYLLKPKWKWKMLTNYWKFPNRSIQTFGFVYHDTNGQNHGPVRKTQLFLLSGICMVILWQDCYVKGNLRKSYGNMAGRKFQIVNVSLYIVNKDYSYLCMWMT